MSAPRRGGGARAARAGLGRAARQLAGRAAGRRAAGPRRGEAARPAAARSATTPCSSAIRGTSTSRRRGVPPAARPSSSTRSSRSRTRSSTTAGASGRARSPARALAAVDRHALRAADLVVADTRAHADHLAWLAGLEPDARRRLPRRRRGARLHSPAGRRGSRSTCLFVGKLIPLHGLETILAAARLAPELRFRVVGSGQLDALLADAPANVEHVPWVEYERLPAELHRAGCALGDLRRRPARRRG